jgi:hypothetical protein
VVSLAPHITSEEKKHMANIKAEKTPVLTLKLSVGRFSEDVAVATVCLGENHIMRRTSKGRMIPIAIMRDGVAVISFRKQMISPTMPKMMTANVPLPMPKTNP